MAHSDSWALISLDTSVLKSSLSLLLVCRQDLRDKVGRSFAVLKSQFTLARDIFCRLSRTSFFFDLCLGLEKLKEGADLVFESMDFPSVE